MGKLCCVGIALGGEPAAEERHSRQQPLDCIVQAATALRPQTIELTSPSTLAMRTAAQWLMCSVSAGMNRRSRRLRFFRRFARYSSYGVNVMFMLEVICFRIELGSWPELFEGGVTWS